MRLALAVLLVLHGAIHTLGFAKAFGLADVPQLQQPIPPRVGLLWLIAGLLLAAAAIAIVAAPQLWWAPALGGVVLSQALITGAWGDARFGTVANLVVLVPLALTLADLRPSSLQSEFRREVKAQLAHRGHSAPPVGEADLARLPEPVARYLRRAGVVGRPRVRDFHVVLTGEIRSAPDAPWMPFTAEQYGFFHPAARYFYMTARRAGIPATGLHRYVGPDATMRIRLLGLFPLVDAAGPEMDASETVTLLNDMFIFAPAALVDAPVEWDPIDDRRVGATFVNAGHRVSAVALFDEAGDLVDFVSEDRYRYDPAGSRRARWSTPLRDHRDFGPARLASGGEGVWTDRHGEWSYLRLRIEFVEYNVSGR